MTNKSTNRRPLAYGLIAIGFIFEFAAIVYMVTAKDGTTNVPVAVLVLITGLWISMSGIGVLSKAQQAG